MKYYAAIDTNVLVSAMLKWDSIPGNVMEMVFDGSIIPVLNECIVNEYQNVLLRPKFHLTEDIVHDVLESFKSQGIYVDAETIDMELPTVLYEVVMEKLKTEDTYLVTGNIKHFPQKPFIVTPREMIDIILANHVQ